MGIYFRNIVAGMRSVLDVCPKKITKISLLHSSQTDAEALAGDWQKVGDDMRFAMSKIDDEQKPV